MARLRDRRERGFVCYNVEVCDADLDGLIARGLLDRVRRNDSAAVQHALHSWLGKLSQ